MKNWSQGQSLLAGLALAASMSTASAQSAPSADTLKPLLTKGACLGCHAVDKKVVGPAFSEVAVKYKGDAGAADRLATKIKQGGSGVWGPVPMPPAAALDAAEAKTLATWVLAGAPSN